jgi:hypothetical protein
MLSVPNAGHDVANIDYRHGAINRKDAPKLTHQTVRKREQRSSFVLGCHDPDCQIHFNECIVAGYGGGLNISGGIELRETTQAARFLLGTTR